MHAWNPVHRHRDGNALYVVVTMHKPNFINSQSHFTLKQTKKTSPQLAEHATFLLTPLQLSITINIILVALHCPCERNCNNHVLNHTNERSSGKRYGHSHCTNKVRAVHNPHPPLNHLEFFAHNRTQSNWEPATVPVSLFTQVHSHQPRKIQKQMLMFTTVGKPCRLAQDTFPHRQQQD